MGMNMCVTYLMAKESLPFSKYPDLLQLKARSGIDFSLYIERRPLVVLGAALDAHMVGCRLVMVETEPSEI